MTAVWPALKLLQLAKSKIRLVYLYLPHHPDTTPRIPNEKLKKALFTSRWEAFWYYFGTMGSSGALGSGEFGNFFGPLERAI